MSIHTSLLSAGCRLVYLQDLSCFWFSAGPHNQGSHPRSRRLKIKLRSMSGFFKICIEAQPDQLPLVRPRLQT